MLSQYTTYSQIFSPNERYFESILGTGLSRLACPHASPDSLVCTIFLQYLGSCPRSISLVSHRSEQLMTPSVTPNDFSWLPMTPYASPCLPHLPTPPSGVQQRPRGGCPAMTDHPTRTPWSATPAEPSNCRLWQHHIIHFKMKDWTSLMIFSF